MAPRRKLGHTYKRAPVPFGPFPGPRQSFDGFTRDGTHSTNVEAYITFKTSQAALIPLLPDMFTFQQPGADAFVTIAPKELNNLEWLGGHGYSLYSVYIHGIRYKAADGKVYNGTFLPILWEDFADPIISGREELGYPKLFADLNIGRTETSYSMNASWKGTVFGVFELKNLKPASQQPTCRVAATGPLEGNHPLPPGAHRDPNILLYRYIPAVGSPDLADAEYPVYVSADAETRLQKATTLRSLTCSPRDASFHWVCSEANKLPTLHHVVDCLAGIPVTEVIACGVTEKTGVSDLSSARRVDCQRPDSKL